MDMMVEAMPIDKHLLPAWKTTYFGPLVLVANLEKTHHTICHPNCESSRLGFDYKEIRLTEGRGMENGKTKA